MKKSIYLFFISFCLYKIAYCKKNSGGDIDWKEDYTSLEEVGTALVIGAVIILIGYLLKKVKPIEVLGKIFIVIGALFGGSPLFVFVIQIIEYVITKILRLADFTFHLALKVGLVVWAILVVYSILKKVYKWLSGNN